MKTKHLRIKFYNITLNFQQKFIGSKDNNINNQCQWMNDSNDENFNHHEKNDNKKLEHRNYESKISNAKNTLYDRISSDSEFDECDSIMEVAPKNTKISSKKKNQDNTLNSSQEKPVKKIKKPIKKITNVSKGKKSKNNDSLNTTSEDGQPVRKPRGRPRGPNSKLNKKSEIENKKSN